MVHYILQTIAFQVFFLLVYDVLLKKETFFNWNRVYLLATVLLSLILPFVKIEGFKYAIPQNFIVSLPEVILGQPQSINNLPFEATSVISESTTLFTWKNAFYVGVFIAFTIFLFKLFKILTLMYKSPKIKMGKLKLVQLIKSNAAFSFFNYIFLGEGLNDKEKETILKHELVHVNQKHTLDLLFFEVLRIVFWFNPLVYIYQNKMMVLHEFIADAEAVKHQNKSAYYQNLLAQVFETKSMSFINPFFKQSLIKKRITMLQKSKSKQINLLKYALLVPMVLGMMVYTSCVQTSNAQDENSKTTTKLVNETPLIEKIKAVKKQIETQGNVNKEEEEGLNLLLQVFRGNEFDSKLLAKVQIYKNLKDKTPLVEKIYEVFKQIEIQGNISEEEERKVKGLLIFIAEDGFNDPFFEDIIKDVDIPFAVIDQVPIFPGCEDLSEQEQRDCMSRNVNIHVSRNFNTKLANDLKLTGRQRINVIFKINNEGEVVGVSSRAPHPELEAEAIRVIKTLPKFKPGEHQGKKVNVSYSLPIIFEVAVDKPKE
ncbi:M56 family metallopeptidase [Sabulilitoribacter multivorans]|uniref:M56 family metallopeptidase n=1 Tax=Flaviramulus multivorans TaxID=1304750 RepID=A0ABS9IH38_9FLAO|nr:M56 family metallopeptidase [Flaviramulus multivorans]MCF7559935.1 M56 family metallopeptidase [Flaviramulus multivorans]